MGKAKQSSDVDLGYLNDESLLAKGKQQFEGSSLNKQSGKNHKERMEEKLESKKAAKKAAAKSVGKGDWKKQAGGIFFLVFMCGLGLMNFLSTMMDIVVGSGITTLDIADTAKLKTVLFGGDPWLVYCVNKETENQKLPKVIEDSARTLSSNLGMQVATLKCWDKTDSGRSIAQRFKLKLSPPLSFVVANGNKPRKIELVGISNADQLEKRVAPALKLDTYLINTLAKWKTYCTSRKTCVVVGHRKIPMRDTALNILKPMLEQHRAVKMVTLDTSFWQLKLEDPVLATRGSKGGADILCLSRSEGAGGNATYSGRFLPDLTYSAAKSFMKACAAQEGLVPIGEAPRINARPSKPKKAEPAPMPAPRPPPRAGPSPPPPADRGNVDRVGSRETLENEEPLFEAVDEEEGAEEGGDEDEEGDEVEL